MELSIFLAKWFGLYMIIMGVIWLLRKDSFVRVVNDLFDSPGSLAIAGIMALFLGLAILIAHPVWELSWRGLITLFGVSSTFKGILYLGFQDAGTKMYRGIVDSSLNFIWILFVLVLGAFLSYVGFTFTV